MARFTLPARLIVAWWPTSSQPATLTGPTAANITASTKMIGTSQGEGLAALEGWQLDPQVLETPDYVSLVVSTVPGQVKVPVSKISLWMDTTDRTMYDAIAVNATGVVGFFFDGTATGKESKLYVVTCISKERHFERDAGHQVTFGFSPAAPVLGAVVA